MSAEAVERTGRDQRLEHTLVAETEIDAIREVVKRRELALAPRAEDRIDRRSANVPNRAEAEADGESAVILRARSALGIYSPYLVSRTGD
jgi:hypothetical protein